MTNTNWAIAQGAAYQTISRFPTTLGEALRAAAAERPERGVVHVRADGSEREQTYPQLLADSERVLGGLRALGLQAGDKVIVEVQESSRFLPVFWGCVLGGLLPAPLHVPASFEPDSNEMRKTRNVRKLLGNPLIVTDGYLVPKYAGLQQHDEYADLRVIAAEELLTGERDGRHWEADAGDIAFLQFSSGSTGDPKGVQLTHRNLVHNAVSIMESAELTGEDVLVNWMPYYHDMGLIVFHLTPVLLGAKHLKMSHDAFVRKPELLLRKITAHRGTMTGSPNFGLDWMTTKVKGGVLDELDLSSLRLIINGAEPISVRTTELFMDKFAACGLPRHAMRYCYGMAEACVGVAAASGYLGNTWQHHVVDQRMLASKGIAVPPQSPDAPTLQLADEGVPFPGMEIRIVDDHDRLLPECQVGHIQIKGPNVTAGYYQNSQSTINLFSADGFLRTGDLGFMKNGRLVATGRNKDVLFINGQNFYAHDVEELLIRELGFATQAVVVCGLHDEAAGRERVLVFVKYKKKIADLIPLYQKVKLCVNLSLGFEIDGLIPVHSIPKTTSGKLERYKLRMQYQQGEFDDVIAEFEAALGKRMQERGIILPRTDAERRLHRIWSRVLGVQGETLSVEDHFVELSASSLKMMEMLREVEALAGERLELAVLYHHPTIARLAAYVADRLEHRPEAARSVIEARGWSEYEVTNGQRALWFLQQLEPDHVAYNEHVRLEVRGALDVAGLRGALEELIERHAVLRTVFREQEGVVKQVIAEVARVELAVHDFNGIRMEELERFLQVELKRPFRLESGPLVRFALCRVAEEVSHFYVVMHHIISDGASMGVFLNELSALYRGQELPELMVQFGDYAEWRQEQLGTDATARAERYWLECLQEPLPVLDLPADHPRPAVRTHEGAVLHHALNPAWSGELKELCQRCNASLYMVLLAAYVTWLHRVTEERDLIVGVPLSGRSQAGTEGLIGYFVNTMPLRFSFAGGETLEDVLEQVKVSVLQAIEHQAYPFDLLVERLNPVRDLSRSVLYSTVFNMYEWPDVQWDGLDVRLLDSAKITAVADLGWIVLEKSDGLQLDVEYDVALFERETVQRFVAQYERVLGGMLTAADQSVAGLDLLGEEDRALQAALNDTQAAFEEDATLAELFYRTAAVHADRTAVSDERVSLTYRELNRRSNRVAHALRQGGVGANDLVALVMERGADFLVAVLGVLKAGGAYVPVDEGYPDERVRLMLEDSGAGIVLTQQPFLQKASMGGGRAYVLGELLDGSAGAEDEDLEVCNRADDLAYVIYTSGSTGRPKGTMLAQRGVVNLVEWKRREFGYGEADTVLQFASFSFDASIAEIFPALLNGAHLHVLTGEARRSADAYADEAARMRATVAELPTVFFNLLAQGEGLERLVSLRLLFVAGDALQAEAVRAWQRRAGLGTQLVNAYGPTEGTVCSTAYRIEGEWPEGVFNVPIGRPVSNVQVHILNQSLQPCPVHVPGEMYISGVNVARGYLHLPGHEAFQGCLYKTGDRARLLPDGNIEFLGRADAQVKVRGYRIETGEIEEVLLQHPSVRIAAVVAQERGLVGFYTGEPADVRAFLKEKLPDYMVPAQVVRLEEMPLLPNGKVCRKALLAAAEAVDWKRDYVAPSNDAERKMAAIWADVLKVEPIGAQDDFFALGGHSLLATQVINRVQNEWGTRVQLRDLFAYPTLGQLAAHVDLLGTRPDHVLIPRLPEQESYELSNAQKRLWFLHQYDPSSRAYNSVHHAVLLGELDVALFRQALERLVLRHDALRTRFVWRDGEPRQIVSVEAEFEFVHEPDVEDVQARIRKSEAVPFDLAAGPLLRVMLFPRGEETYFYLNMHHIITDGWSLELFMRELSDAYGRLAEGRQPELAPLSLRYVEYAAWQAQELAKGRWNAEQAYWLDKLAKPLPVLELPLDHPRPAERTHAGDMLKIGVSEELTRRLHAVGRQEDVSLYMLLLAAYVMLLQNLSNQEDILVGTPVAGRTVEALEPVLGFFVNTLAIRTSFAGVEILQDLLRSVKRTVLEAHQHQSYPFDLLIEQVNPERDRSRSPIFSTMFIHHQVPLTDQPMGPLLMRPAWDEMEHEISKFDLTLVTTEGAESLEAWFEYNTDLFRRATVRNVAQGYVQVLEAFAERLTVPVAELELLSAGDQAAYAELNQTASAQESEATIVELFDRQAAEQSERPAVSDGVVTLTYRELQERANRVAHVLRECGVGVDSKANANGGRVALMIERGVEAVVAMLGVLKAGGAYVPVDPSYPEERVRLMLEDSGVEIVLAQQTLLQKASVGGAQVVVLSEIAEETPRANPETRVAADDPAYVIYTSGSTGRPKGTVLSHRGVVNLVQWKRAQFGYGADDTVLQFASYSFDASVAEIFPALLNGAHLHVLTGEQRQCVHAYAQAVSGTQATVAELPTVFFNLLAQDGDLEKLRSMRVLFVAGEAMQGESVRMWQRRGGTEAQLVNAYGPTEMTVCATAFEIPGELPVDVAQVPIGQPIANVEVRILNRLGQPCPVNVAGELHLKGPGLAKGYLHLPEHEAFSNGWYRTGDMARLLPNGHLEFVGRVDAQVKVRGYRVETGEIEAVLLRHPQVKIAAAVAHAGVLAGFYTGEPADLRAYLADKLPDYMVPARVVLLDDMPVLPNGKVDRKALQILVSTVDQHEDYVDPVTETEQKLARIWGEVLKRERVGLHDDFFALGGHSLLATQVINRIQNEWGAPVRLKDLFAYPTLGRLAAHLDAWEAVSVPLSIPRLPEQESYELSNAQKRLWFLHQFDPASPAYHSVYHAVLLGELDVEVFRRAVEALVRRHEALRTRFVEMDGEPRQVIAEKALFDFAYEPDAVEVREAIRKSEAVPFDLASGPLLRVMLFAREAGETYLYLNMHHIITDGWSMELFLRELSEAYGLLLQGKQPELARPALRYVDYAAWQGENGPEEEAYWLEQLAKPLPVLELPNDFPRPSEQTFAGELFKIGVSGELTERLQALAKREDVSLYMLLLAAYVLLLQHLSNQDDIIVGTPVAGRTREELEPVLGFFVNTLAVRTRLEGVRTPQELLRAVKAGVLEAHARQTYPFDLLIERVNPERDRSRSPIFSTMFIHQPGGLDDQPMGPLTMRPAWEKLEHRISKFDLTLVTAEGEQELAAWFEFNTDLFRRETVGRFAASFAKVLEAFAGALQEPIGSLDLLADADHAVYAGMNATHVEYGGEQLLLAPFLKRARQHPERVAVSYEGEALTYGELHELSNRLAHFLRGKGVRPNQLVAILMERGLEMMVGLYGIVKSGAAYVPVDPEYPAELVRYMIADSGADVLVTRQAYAEQAAELAGNLRMVVMLDEERGLEQAEVAAAAVAESAGGMSATRPVPRELVVCVADCCVYHLEDLRACPAIDLPVVNQPDDLAYMIYTSGSTGWPKGVRISHRAIDNLLNWHQDAFYVDEEDVVAQRTSICFDASVWELFWALRHGARVSILPTDTVRDLRDLHRHLVRERVTIIQFVPSLLTAFVQVLEELGEEQRLLPHLRWVTVGGEALPLSTVNRWFALYPNGAGMANTYGPTEAAVDASCAIYEGPQERITIGAPIANTQLYVLDRYGKLCPVGVEGELHVGGVQLAEGYHNHPEKTAESFVAHELAPRLYRTGDRARLLADGTLDYLGRLDHQVKVRGYRIELGEIEETMRRHPAVGMAAAVVEKGVLCGFYTSAVDIDPPDLHSYLSAHLQDYMVPPRLLPLDAMPLSPNGKVDRKALAELAGRDSFDEGSEDAALETVLEQVVAAVWREVLEADGIGAQANFFDLGGHSLLITQVISRLERATGIRLFVKDFFEHQTVRALAACCQTRQATSHRPLMQLPKQESYDLSPAQLRMWFAYQMDPLSTHYNVQASPSIEGDLQVGLFEQALQIVVQQQASLRTIFVEKEGVPRQVVLEEAEIPILFHDLRGWKDEEQQRFMEERIEAISGPFDLSQAPLMRVLLFHLGERSFRLATNDHHIISDGWSKGVLIEEWAATYHGLLRGEVVVAEPHWIQYVDYAAWQNERIASGELDQEKEYWLRTLVKPLPVLELPLDRPRPEWQTHAGDMITVPVGAELRGRLLQVAKETGTTPNMVALAAYFLLLHRLTNERDLIVGTPVAARTERDLERLYGVFINTVAIRVQVEEARTFRELLERVKERTLEALDHQAYPFEAVVEAVQPVRDKSRAPIFQAFFDFENVKMDARSFEGLTFSEDADAVRHSLFDLEAWFMEREEGYHLSFIYNVDLFERETVANMLEQYVDILSEAAAGGVERELHAFDLLTERDRAVLEEMNRTEAEYDLSATLLEAFAEQAEAHPERVALCWEGETMTYGELQAHSNRVAHFLRGQGVRPNQLVAVMMERGLELMVSIYGIVTSGAAYVPIDPEYPADRVTYMLEDSGAEVLVTKSRYASVLNVPSLKTLVLADGVGNTDMTDMEDLTHHQRVDTMPSATVYTWRDILAHPPTTPKLVNAPTDRAYMIYTSGSTGKPKGVVITHRAILNRLLWHQATFQATPDDVVAQRTSVCFDVSVWELFWPLRHGARLSIVPTETVKNQVALHRHLQREGVTVMHFVPALFSAFVATLEEIPAAQRQLPSLRWIITSGEALPLATVNHWYDLNREGAPIANLYGPTEAAVDVTCALLHGPQTRITIGKPIANTRLYVLDAHGNRCPIGVPGELHIGGVQLAEGYLNQPEKTASSFFPHALEPRLYRTGDRARVLADGSIDCLGRLDNQVKVRGFRIELGEIEEALSQHPSVELAAVIARRGADGNNMLTGFYKAKEPLPDLTSFLAQKLPDYMIPPRLHRLDDMPLSPNGKVGRSTLAQLEDSDAFCEPQPFAAPSTPTEIRLAALWSEALQKDSISARDHFFELGGHSLLAMQLVNRLYREFGVKVELKTLFAHPTLEALAACIDRQEQQSARTLAPAPVREHYPLSHAQKRLWFFYRMDPSSNAYTIPLHLTYQGALDVPRLEQAFRQLVQRHAALRTVFTEIDGEPRQMILPNCDFQLELTDGEQMRDEIAACEATPYDLAKGPLFRVRVFQQGEDDFYLYLNLHHIITDGWSNEVLLSEWMQLYAGAELPQPRLQYVDYAEWQAGHRNTAEEDYWLRTLAKPLPVLRLPTDHPRPPVQTFRGGLVQATAPTALLDELRLLARQQDVSMYMLLLSAYVLLLHDLTQDRDIIVGTPMAGRTSEELEGIVGYLANTLAIRVRWDGVETHGALLRQVKRQVLDAYEHQGYPFDLLIETLNPERDKSRPPVFSTMFTHAGEEQARGAGGFRLVRGEGEQTASKFELSAFLQESEAGLLILFEYNRDLFEKATVERFLEQFLTLLESLGTAAPLRRIDRHALTDLALHDDVLEATRVFIPPSTPSEHRVAQVWADVLRRNVETISVTSSFFDHGGHSLMLMQVHSRLGADLEFRELFANHTVRELAACLDARLEKGSVPSAALIPQAPPQEHYALSHAQKRLWFLHQFDPASTAYTLGMSAVLEGRVDVSAFERALRHLADRHESLRTVFFEVDGVPRQAVQAESHFRMLTEEAEDLQSFDLTNGPLWRACLQEIGEGRYRFFLHMHHIITDGWSLDLFLKELSVSYQAFANGEEPDLPPQSLRYTDYAEWQTSLAWELEEAYWLDKLSKPLPTLELPLDFPRLDVQTFRGGLVRLELPKTLSEQLRDVAKQEDVSLFMLLLSAYVLMLHQQTEQEDLIVGTPIAGRLTPELERVFGFFANTLALRTQIDPEQTVRDLLARVKETCLEAYEHQSYPFDLLIEKVNPERDLSRSPIFSTMFLYQQEAEAQGFDFAFHPLEQEHQVSKFDLTLSLTEGRHGLSAALEFNTDLFRRDTAQRFLARYVQAAEAFVTRLSERVKELDLLTEEDAAVYARLNDTHVDYDLNQLLHGAFIEQAEAHPERIALSCEGKTMTYGELHRRSNQVAHFLRARGVGRNQWVALMAERGFDLLIGIYGILKAGAAYVPVDPEYPAERIQYMLEDSEAPILLTNRTNDGIDLAGVAVYDLRDLGHLPATTPPPINEPADRAYMIYTSGSTGRPKGVVIRHESILNRLLWHQDLFQATPEDVAVQRTTPCFDDSVIELFWPLRHGARLLILPGEIVRNAHEMLARIEQEGATYMQFVPSLLHAILNTLRQMPADQRPRLALRLIITAGEALPLQLANQWFELFPSVPLANLYGPTEAAVNVTRALFDGPLERVTIGIAVPNTQVGIVNRHGQLCPVGVPGELLAGGVQLAEGYHNQPDKTAAAFVPNHLPHLPGKRLYRTGDLARLLTDGTIEYLGRFDNQVKVRGFRIELGEIEAALTTRPDVETAAVVTRRSPDGSQALFGFYTSPRTDLEAAELQIHLACKLPDYMVPPRLVQLAQLPLTPNGKVDRQALRQQAAQDRWERTGEPAAPVTPTERRLAAIWSEVLGVEGIGLQDNFFALGGHSLLLMQVQSRLRSQLRIAADLKTMFAHPTLGSLSAWIDAQGTEAVLAPTRIPRAPEQPHYALSHAQKRLWFLQQMNPDSTVYNVPVHLTYEGMLNTSAFEQALLLLLERHDSLRTVFREIDGMPRQIIQERTDFVLEKVKVASLAELRAHIAASEAVPFRLSEGPLFRATLFEREEHRYDLHLNMHHIITDGWSHEVLVSELAAIYETLVHGAEPSLPPHALRYADYAEWQAKGADGDWVADTAYWKQQLSAPLPLLDLPTDFPRPDVQTYRGDLVTAALPQELLRDLRDLCLREDASLFMVGLAAYTWLLHHLSQHDDIIVGTPIAGRTEEAEEGLVGLFVNSLAIRTSFEEVSTLRDLLQQIKRRALEAFEHQTLPFDLLIDTLQVERRTDRPPVFSTMFSYQKGTQPSADFFQPARMEGEHRVAKMDLTLVLMEQEESCEVAFEYNTDLFRKETVARFAELLHQVLEAFAKDLHEPLSALDLLPVADRALYAKINDTASPFPHDRTIHERFREVAARQGDRLALSDPGTQWTYRELDRRTDALACELQARGVVRGEIVGILMERTAEAILAMLGVLKSGAAYLPLDPDYPQERLRYMIEDSGAGMILTCAELSDRIEANARTLLLESLALDNTATEPVLVPLQSTPDDLAYLIYTSGSTGQPKGTPIRHVGVLNLAQWKHDAYDLGTEDTALQFNAFAFDASVSEIYCALLNGAHLRVLSREERLSPAAFAGAVDAAGATNADLPPVFFNLLTQLLPPGEEGKLRTLRRLFIGGEALAAAHVRAWQQRFGTGTLLINAYGPTETTVYATSYPVPADLRDNRAYVPIGQPMSNLQVRILNRRRQLCPVGVVGEMYITAVGLALGYLNQPEKTASAFLELDGTTWYRTGDLARLRADGQIEIVGRGDAQVKIRGHRIELGEVEAALLRHPQVAQAAVIAEERGGIKQLIAYYAVPETGSLPADALRRDLARQLPPYMLPSLFRELEEMPLLPSGKLDRRSLPPVQDSVADRCCDATPPSPLQQQIASVWSSCLGGRSIGLQDNFFTSGGDSIIAMQTVALLNQAGLRLHAVDLFRHQTVSELAQHVEENSLWADSAAEERPPLVGEVPLSPAQQAILVNPRVDHEHFLMPLALDIDKAVDPARMQQTLQHLLAHHDMLRATYVRAGEEVRQTVLAPEEARINLHVHDLSALDEAERAAEIQRLETQAAGRIRFDGTLPMQALLFRLGEAACRFVWVLHHWVNDTVSHRILSQDLIAAYEALERGQQPILPRKTASYAEWAATCTERLQCDRARADALDYWQPQLDMLQSASLPADHPEGRNRIRDIRVHELLVDEPTTERLRTLPTARHGAGLRDVLLAIVVRALHRWTGHSEVALAVNAHGRDETLDLSRTVGFFSRAFPLAVHLPVGEGAADTLRHLRNHLARMPQGGASTVPSFRQPDVLLNFHGEADNVQPASGAWKEGAHTFLEQPLDDEAMYKLLIHGVIREGCLRISFGCSVHQYRPATIARLSELFLEELQQLLV